MYFDTVDNNEFKYVCVVLSKSQRAMVESKVIRVLTQDAGCEVFCV